MKKIILTFISILLLSSFSKAQSGVDKMMKVTNSNLLCPPDGAREILEEHQRKTQFHMLLTKMTERLPLCCLHLKLMK